MLEIDLSGVDAEMVLNMANFEHHVIHDAPRHWIHNPRGEAQYGSNLKELHAYVEQINIKLYPKRVTSHYPQVAAARIKSGSG